MSAPRLLRRRWLAVLGILCWTLPAAGEAELDSGLTVWRRAAPEPTAEGPLHRVVIYTPVFHVEQIFKSMQGPGTGFRLSLLAPGEPPELLWLKAISSEVVAADGGPAPQELMCHVNVDHDVSQRRANVGHRSLTSRLATLSQGQFHSEMPAGFAIPIFSTESLRLDSMVLNHNFADGSFDVRHRITVSFLRDSELQRRPRPLMQATVSGRLAFRDGIGHTGQFQADADGHSSCLPSEQQTQLVDKGLYRPASTGHWLVAPGRQVNETLVTRQLGLPYDTTIHRIDVHLHPFAESLELRDLTTGKTLFLSRATPPERGVGLARVETYESAEGIAVYSDHEYGLISVYENGSESDQTAMAVMYIHLLDQTFDDRQIEATLGRLSAEAAGPDRP